MSWRPTSLNRVNHNIEILTDLSWCCILQSFHSIIAIYIDLILKMILYILTILDIVYPTSFFFNLAIGNCSGLVVDWFSFNIYISTYAWDVINIVFNHTSEFFFKRTHFIKKVAKANYAINHNSDDGAIPTNPLDLFRRPSCLRMFCKKSKWYERFSYC